MQGFSRPQLYTASEGEERHATWLELFFDLVFVVAVSQLAHLLHDDLSWHGLFHFTALFVVVWWQWIDFSYYCDQYDTDDLLHRVGLLATLFFVIVLAQAIPHAFDETALSFGATVVALRALMIAFYIRAWRHVPESRELTTRYLISFCIAFVVWFAALFVDEPLRFWLWFLAQTIEILNGPLTYATIKNVPAQVSHMDERFGLFVIIVLGEAVVAVASGVFNAPWETRAVVTAVCGFTIAACAWWLYFYRADPEVITRALRSNRVGLLRSYVYGYSHFLVFAGITAAGVGVQESIKEVPEGHLSTQAGVVLFAGLAAFLIGVSALQWATPASLPRRILGARAAAVCLIGVLVALAGTLGPILLLCALLGVFMARVFFESHICASVARCG